MEKFLELDNWSITSFCESQINYNSIIEQKEWISVGKSADIQTCLINKGIIKDPAYGTNDVDQFWVEKKVWVYKTILNVDDNLLKYNNIDLEALGLDTYSTIYVNGYKIADTNNMFIKHTFNIKDFLRIGNNEIVIVFPILNDFAKTESLPEGFWTNYSTERAFSRKAGYSFGWDWTPRVATIGIWKPVNIVFHSKPIIKDVSIKTILNKDYSECKVGIEIILNDLSICSNYTVIIKSPSGSINSFDSDDELIIKEPALWNVHDQGIPNLYKIKIITDNDIWESSFGIRKVELITKAQDGSDLFLFKINNKGVFCRGANWVPVSNRPGNSSKEYYEKLIKMTVNAGMNILVLWGGGIYEPELFYNLCDKYGIVVLQYFMFACGEYPDWDKNFIENVKTEVFQQVKRLDNHPSVIMYIGNVENTMISEKIKLDRPIYGDKLFFEYIPQWLKTLNSDRFYQPTSPYGGNSANSEEKGDRHNWDLWFSDLPYYDYAKDFTRFSSEFGIHATPVYESVIKYCGKKNLKLTDFEFKYFNRDQDLSRMLFYINEHIGVPTTVKEYCDMSLLVQAEALKFACEHYRRRFPLCSGAAVWQLNDCCGVQSWSIIDYDLIPKASYYYIKKAFASVNISIRYDSENESTICVCNNSDLDIKKHVKIQISDFFGNVVYTETLPCNIKKGKVLELKNIALGGRFYPNVIIGNRQRFYYLSAEIIEDKLVSVRLFDDIKNLVFPSSNIDIQITKDEIILKAKRFTKFVQISGDMSGIELEDNFCDLLPNEPLSIKYKTNYEGNRIYKIESWNSSPFNIKL